MNIYEIGVLFSIVVTTIFNKTRDKDDYDLFASIMFYALSWITVSLFIGDIISNKINTGNWFPKK